MQMNSGNGRGKAIILMGVSGSGKSAVGACVAQSLTIKFIDGDDLHPRANICKMANGRALDDEDRLPWLERISDAVFSLESKSDVGLIVCSALKRAYRDRIRAGNGPMLFVYLDGPFEVILERMSRRSGHFMKESMLRGQFEALERPCDEPDVRIVDIRPPLEHVIAMVGSAVKAFIGR